jgi:hypothetical protein
MMNTQREQQIVVGSLSIHLVWFDSLGAKSSCVFIRTPDISLLVDPGAAEMQPSYPLTKNSKKELRQEAVEASLAAAKEADAIFISHYHYDHHLLPEEAPKLYKGKRLWIKDPNQWICRSQWQRARKFLHQLAEITEEQGLGSEQASSSETVSTDPLEQLPLAANKEYGDYTARKKELMQKGRMRFQQLVEFWLNSPAILEGRLGDININFADGKELRVGSTTLRFTKPMFHGLEYTALGWVIGLVIEHKGAKVLYTSDIQGPTIEDYAQWVIDENPSILIVDGPPTYLFGFMVNRINLDRCIENMCNIIHNTSTQTIIYDHHLLRDRRYKERTAKVWDIAREEGKHVVTAAEQLGREPFILAC